MPWPRLNARDITLGNPEWADKENMAENMAEIQQLTFSVSPLPLINKKIVISSLALERLADGRNNWTFKSGCGVVAFGECGFWGEERVWDLAGAGEGEAGCADRRQEWW